MLCNMVILLAEGAQKAVKQNNLRQEKTLPLSNEGA